MKKLDKVSRERTQDFTIRFILTKHTGKILTPKSIDKLCKEIEEEMRDSVCSWAFTVSEDINDES